MLERVERRRRGLVQLVLEAVQGGNEREGSLDRVDALAGVADVRGRAPDVDVEPEHTDLSDRDRARKRLGDHGSIRARSRQHALERPVAGALFLDDRLELNGRQRREA